MLKSAFFLIIFISFLNASIEKFSISVCTTLTLENALLCKKGILESNNNEVFIVKEKNEKFTTYFGIFESITKANQIISISSNYVKQQKPFAKKLNDEILNYKLENKSYIDLNKPNIQNNSELKSQVSTSNKKDQISDTSIYTKKEIEHLEELIKISLEEFERDKLPEVKEIEKKLDDKKEFNEVITQKTISSGNSSIEKKLDTTKIVNYSISDISQYEQIQIEVDSVSNSMVVKARINNEFRNIKTYKVSTGKKDIKKPFGEGKVSLITINPTWYPTANTLESFRKKGIYLPDAVPPGHKFNYMGAAKINLTHTVDGKNIFRIHGTLDEKTIGTNESSGCIRMKNNEVLQLASLLNEFATSKSLDNIKVILR